MARQRSTKAHQGVLNAALELFAERGIDRTSMDAISERSGVSKATIYKHWTDKEALLLEVIASAQGACERPRIESGDSRTDLIAILAHRPPQKADPGANGLRERLMPHLIAYSAHNPKFGAAWRSMMMEPARQEIKQVLMRGIANGEFLRGLDYDLAMGLLLGPMLYRHIFQASNPSPPDDFSRQVVDAFQRAFGRPVKTTSTGTPKHPAKAAPGRKAKQLG